MSRWKLPEATLLIAAGTVYFYIMGYARQEAYLHRMGLPYNSVFYDTPHYLVAGFAASLPFVFIFASAFAGYLLGTGRRQVSKPGFEFAFAPIDLIALAFGTAAILGIASAFGEGRALAAIDPEGLFGAESLLSVVAGVILGKVWEQYRPVFVSKVGRPIRALLPILQGIMVVFTALLLFKTSTAYGWWDANDELWGVKPHVVTSFEWKDGNDRPSDYLLITHHAGRFYVRNVTDVGGKTTDFWVIQESELVVARLSVAKAYFIPQDLGDS